MAFKIALIGNPNCGKTTIFNKLTGSSQYVGNWPGVTVEKKEGFLKRLFSRSKQQLEGILSKYDSLTKEVDTVYNEIQKYEVEI